MPNKIIPQNMIAYLQIMRLHQSTGIFLLLWPCLISLALASESYPNPILVVIFVIGSVLMRGAGCIINDMVDYKLDQKVERTKDRPLASGSLSFTQATKFLAGLLILSSSLLLFLNKFAALICLSSIIPVIIYPFCKRFTYWPQLCLGLTFNIGAIVSWVAVKGQIDSATWFLYFGCVFWTLGYDTIYAHQDVKDDLSAGVKSTAILFGDKTEQYLNAFYTITATFFTFAGGLAYVSLSYYLVLSLAVIVLFWQTYTFNPHDSSNCARRFKSNVLVGGLVFLAALASKT